MTAAAPLRKPLLRLHPVVEQGLDAFHVRLPDTRGYIRISYLDGLLLQEMDGSRSPEELAAKLRDRGRHCSTEYVERLIRRFGQLGLLQGTESHKAQKGPWYARLFYLRIPLLDPDPWLAIPARLWAVACSRFFLLPFLAVLASAFYLLASDPRALARSAYEHFTLAGLPTILLAVVFVKILHELAHAAAGKRYGCEVREAGLLFLCLLPCLYVDSTEAWQLREKRKRIEIASAGVLLELFIASIAGIVWYLTDYGAIHAVAFQLCAVSLLASLLFNANPLMRFDGYYVLSDVLEIPNLSPRAQRRMQYLFFGRLLGLPGIEDPAASDREARILTIYGTLSFCYRLLLGLLIAEALYSRFYRGVGILLFLLTIFLLILRPLFSALKTIHAARSRLRPKPLASAVLALAAVLVLLAAFLPVEGHQVVRCLSEGTDPVRVFAHSDARIAELHVRVGDRVRKGQVLLAFDRGRLEHELRLAGLAAKIAEQRGIRLEQDARTRSKAVLELPAIRQAKDAESRLKEEIAELEVRAPMDGIIARMPNRLARGLRMRRGALVLEIVPESRQSGRAILDAHEIGDLSAGQMLEAEFPSLGTLSIPVHIAHIDRLDLADRRRRSRASGPSQSQASGPTRTKYGLRFDWDSVPVPLGAQGYLRIRTEKRPLLGQLWNSAMRRVYKELIF